MTRLRDHTEAEIEYASMYLTARWRSAETPECTPSDTISEVRVSDITISEPNSPRPPPALSILKVRYTKAGTCEPSEG
jgi:hypothetical protein